MSTEAILTWIMGTALTVGMAVFGAGFVAYFNSIKSHASLSERIRVLEVLFESFGRKFAKALHSPHDPYGIDPLLDKYLDRHYELSPDEWNLLLKRCHEIEVLPGISKDHQFFAGMLAAICMQTLQIPPPVRSGELKKKDNL